MADAITVKKRDTRGTRQARRQRAAGEVPAILYGHGKESVSLTVSTHDMQSLLRHGARLVNLTGDLRDSALISQIQWDAFGQEMLHIDFTRVSADERIEVEVPITTRGVAPGISQGGVVEVLVYEVMIACRANLIPEQIEVNINDLELNQRITAADLELPEGAEVIPPGEQTVEELVVVLCEMPREAPEEAEEAATEPEVVGEKEEDGKSEEG